MANFRTLDDLDVAGKRVLVRVDLNVPMKDGKVSDDTRLRAVAPTINELADKGAKVMLLAHFGRPKGKPDPDMSLAPIAPALAAVLGRPVAFSQQPPQDLADGQVALVENTRFHPGEEANDPAMAKRLAAAADLYVNDAFSAAHRAHASTEGVAHLLPSAAGRSMEKELSALSAALTNPERPLVCVVGGAKVSTKLELLGNLSKVADTIIIGGGMANTFLAAQGINVGKSLCEHEMAGTARDILKQADANGCRIMLPVDAVVAKQFAAGAASRTVPVDQIGADEMMLDVGPRSIEQACAAFDAAATLVWNGPFGAFEIVPFDAGTVAAARHAAGLAKAGKLVAVAGGGDTVAALNHAGVADDFTYVSTAGGAFLEWLEGKALPGVEVLRTA
ncbi:MAG: phosphoglycerate kinase [Anderseniella sp.]|jgi:phosphoglycerate kinase|nr:phosphoglycerate kinase [Anderseniella sp.]